MHPAARVANENVTTRANFVRERRAAPNERIWARAGAGDRGHFCDGVSVLVAERVVASLGDCVVTEQAGAVASWKA